MYKNILFDLDGTLTDPKLGITNSIIYALNQLNLPAPKNDELVHFIGPPLSESFEQYYALTGEANQLAIHHYREYFSDKGLFENALYPGIIELLNTLQQRGHRLFVATSKPQIYAEQIVDHFEMTSYFEAVVGSELDGTRSAKGDIITHILHMYQLDASDCIMIGDRKHDLIGAALNQMDAVGVLFGYGSQQELAQCRPKAMIKTVTELSTYLTAH